MTDPTHSTKVLRTAADVADLVRSLSSTTAALAMAVAAAPASVGTLVPAGLEELDAELRQVGMVLSTLAMASSAKTKGFDFDPTPDPAAARRLVTLAEQFAQRLSLSA